MIDLSDPRSLIQKVKDIVVVLDSVLTSDKISNKDNLVPASERTVSILNRKGIIDPSEETKKVKTY